ncbi:MAG TPA: hypothetical protein VFA38_00045 [Nitrospirales bacterium]|nr:hypothetical protein [Nitrospirales bacterium]
MIRPLLPCLLILLVFPSVSSAPAESDAPSPLSRLIMDYFAISNPEQAEAQLQSILLHPDATVDSVRAAVRDGLPRGSAPVGTHPDVPVRVGSRTHRYALYVPPAYSPDRPWPLIVCLHGAGFTGEAYLERWQARLGDRYLLACPTLMAGTWWTREAESLVLATLRDVEARYRIDPDRVFLTGMSNGGIGVYLIGSEHAARFAGLAPMASGLDDVLMPLIQNARNTPIYLIHGVHDDVMPVQLSRAIAGELTRLGYPFIYREHQRTHPMAGGHFFPREELPDLVAWFDAQRRRPSPSHVTLVRDASHLLPFGWLRIDATDRIVALTDTLSDLHDDLIRQKVYAKLDARVVDRHRIDVTSERVRRYTLWLDESLVDLAAPVTIATNGRISFEGTLTPDLGMMLREARRRHDASALYPVSITIAVEPPA